MTPAKERALWEGTGCHDSACLERKYKTGKANSKNLDRAHLEALDKVDYRGDYSGPLAVLKAKKKNTNNQKKVMKAMDKVNKNWRDKLVYN